MHRLLTTAALLLAAGAAGLAAHHSPGPPSATTPVTISGVTAHRSPAGRLFLRLRLRNTTRQTALLTGQLRLTGGPGGRAVGPFPARRAVTLAPGMSAGMLFASGQGLPAGSWRAAVTLVGGGTTVLARMTVQFPASAGVPVPLRLAGTWLATIVLALCIIAGVSLHHLRQARRARRALAGALRLNRTR